MHPGTKVVGDNADLKQNARELLTTHKNPDHHFFNHACIKNRVSGYHLASTHRPHSTWPGSATLNCWRWRDPELHEQWQPFSEEAQDAKVEADEATQQVKDEEEFLKQFKRAKAGRNVDGLTDEPCSLPICALQVTTPEGIDRDAVPWIRCNQCGKGDSAGWYHEYFVGMTNVDVTDDFICPICTGKIANAEDMITIQKERVVTAKANLKDRKPTHKTMQKRVEEVYERGPLEEQFNKVLEKELGVCRQAYHSQCFVGNHCKTILKGRQKLIDVLPDGGVKRKIYTSCLEDFTISSSILNHVSMVTKEIREQ